MITIASTDDSILSLPLYHNPMILDLVAHFLGIAAHDNINGAPSIAHTPEMPVGGKCKESVSGV